MRETVELGTAWYRNWVTVARGPADQAGEAKTRINITVDRGKAREDIAQAREQVQEGARTLKEQVGKLVSGTTLEGLLTSLNSEKRVLTLQVKDKVHTVRVAQNAEIRRGKDKVPLESLKVGELVTVTVKEENGVQVASAVTVNPKS